MEDSMAKPKTVKHVGFWPTSGGGLLALFRDYQKQPRFYAEVVFGSALEGRHEAANAIAKEMEQSLVADPARLERAFRRKEEAGDHA
jgi:hypothetical protein